MQFKSVCLVHVSSSKAGGRDRISLRLLFVCDDQGVKASATSSFRLTSPLLLWDLASRGTLSPGVGAESSWFPQFCVARCGAAASRSSEQREAREDGEAPVMGQSPLCF